MMLLQGSSPTSASGTSSSSLKFTARALGGVYTVVSKQLVPNVSVHLGYMRGNITDLGGNSKFLKKFLPTGNLSELFTQFATGLSDFRTESAPNIIYTGWEFKFLGTPWRFEVLKPFPMSKNPILFNTKIDRLFAFNMAYERWQGGYALLGYFNFRFTLLPTTPKGAIPLQ
jgi:hypothetical protein